MSIFDRVTKAVGDAVDRGKKELDQFVTIQKINGQIGDLEKSISESRAQIEQAKVKIGEMAIEMLNAGTLVSPGMKEFLDQITGFRQQITLREAEIAQKRAEIESLKSEDKVPKASGIATPPVPAPPASAVPPVPPPPPQSAVPVPPPPPVPAVAGRFCQQCGAAVQSGAFCGQCGAKLT